MAKAPKIPPHLVQHIIEPLRSLAVRLDELQLDERNVNQHNQRSIDEIARSLQQFGQKKPIVVRQETMTIVAGNGTWQAMRQLGWEYIAAVIQPMSEIEARAYGIADNRTADFSQFDESLLNEILDELQADGTYTAVDLGFNPDEVSALIDRLTASDEPSPTHEVKPIEEKEPKANQPLKDKYELLIMLETEDQQTELLEELMDRGFKCKALIG